MLIAGILDTLLTHQRWVAGFHYLAFSHVVSTEVVVVTATQLIQYDNQRNYKYIIF